MLTIFALLWPFRHRPSVVGPLVLSGVFAALGTPLALLFLMDVRSLPRAFEVRTNAYANADALSRRIITEIGPATNNCLAISHQIIVNQGCSGLSPVRGELVIWDVPRNDFVQRLQPLLVNGMNVYSTAIFSLASAFERGNAGDFLPKGPSNREVTVFILERDFHTKIASYGDDIPVFRSEVELCMIDWPEGGIRGRYRMISDPAGNLPKTITVRPGSGRPLGPDINIRANLQGCDRQR